MKKLLAVLVPVLLVSSAASLASTKDVEVTNTVDVNVQSLPDQSILVGENHKSVELSCLVGSSSNSCLAITNPDSMNEKLIHAATISLFAEPGYVCRATLVIVDVRDSGFNTADLLQVYATSSTPGALSISLPRPIRLEDRDELRLSVAELGFQHDGCRGTAFVQVEILEP